MPTAMVWPTPLVEMPTSKAPRRNHVRRRPHHRQLRDGEHQHGLPETAISGGVWDGKTTNQVNLDTQQIPAR